MLQHLLSPVYVTEHFATFMMIGKRRDSTPRRGLPRGVIGHLRGSIARDLAHLNHVDAQFKKICPYCESTEVVQNSIGYRDVAGDLRSYSGDLMGFRNVADVAESIARGEFRAVEFDCRSCRKTGVVAYGAQTKETRFFYEFQMKK